MLKKVKTACPSAYLHIALLFFVSMAAAGCLPVLLQQAAVTKDSSGPDRKILEKGYQAFQNGDDKQAETIFTSLQHAKDLTIARKAGYALACLKLASARNSQAKADAFSRWKKWRRRNHGTADRDELQLLEMVIKKQADRRSGSAQAISTLSPADKKQCEQQLALRDKQIKLLNQRINTMKGEVSLLKKKIKSIEEIDQKIQEKKTEPLPLRKHM